MLALGVVVLAATRWIVPEQIYPWITLASGVFVSILGARAVAREVRGARLTRSRRAHRAPASPPHHVSKHAHAHAIAPISVQALRRSGNVAPCPAALVVLLAAISLHQIGYGLALIVAFSAGLALVLTVLGVAVVRGAAWLVARPQFDRVAHVAPLVTASVIALVGAVMVGQGFAAQGVGVSALLVTAFVLAAVAGYAFAWHQHRAPSEAPA